MTTAADEVEISTLEQRPDLEDALWDLGDLWPTFMLHDPNADLYYDRCTRDFRDLVLVAEHRDRPGEVAARGFAIPFTAREHPFPAGGWDAVIRWGVADLLDRRPPTHVSALEITLRPSERGSGLAARMIAAMKDGARGRGAEGLVAPVRPTGKADEPATSMEEYAHRRRPDGLPVDAWLRTHVRVGGEIVRVAPHSMTVVGSLDDWEEWTGRTFDRSGPQIIDGALAPVDVDVDRDLGTYVEPNVWVSHPL